MRWGLRLAAGPRARWVGLWSFALVAVLALLAASGGPRAAAAGDVPITASTTIETPQLDFKDGPNDRCLVLDVAQVPDVPGATYTVTVLDRGNSLTGNTQLVLTSTPIDDYALFVDQTVGTIHLKAPGGMHWYVLASLVGPPSACPDAVTMGKARFSVISAVAHVANLPPVAQFTRHDDPANPLHVTFDGSGSFDPDGSIASYAWSLDENGACGTTCYHATGTSSSLGVTVPHAGSYQVSLTVTDGGGAVSPPSSRAETIGQAGNQPPRAAFTYTIDSSNPLRVHLDGTPSSDPDGQVVRWDWDFGHNPVAGSPATASGGPGVADKLDHIFPAAGTYTVGLTVTDNDPTAPLHGAVIQRITVNGQTIVNSTADTSDSKKGDGVCATGGAITRGSQQEPECTLRAAIEETDAGGGGIIRFDIPVTPTIPVGATALPNLTGNVTIDGTSQPGVAIAGTSGSGTGLTLAGTQNIVKGLHIGGFKTGVDVQAGAANMISGNLIEACTSVNLDGVCVRIRAATGTRVEGNEIHGDTGISDDANAQSSGTSIGGATPTPGTPPGNKIFASSNGIDGTGKNEVVSGNTIAPQPGAAPENRENGIIVSGTNTLIGGTTTTAGNVIGGFSSGQGFRDGIGIWVVASAVGTVIRSNFVGVEADGHTAKRNVIGINADDNSGVVIAENTVSGNGLGIIASDASIRDNRIGTSTDGRSAVPNLIGLEADGDIRNNLISGNTATGLALSGGSASGNKVGTDLAGTLPISNGTGISAAAGTEITGNLVSGNRGEGLVISGGVVDGNLIGTDATGSAPLPNDKAGIRVEVSSEPNANGGPTAIGLGAANTIAFNRGPGVFVLSKFPTTIRGNSIFSNGGLGIDLEGDGVRINFPELKSALVNNLSMPVITGTVDARALGTYTVEVFANRACDQPTGDGEGEALYRIATTTVVDGGAFQVSGTPVPHGYTHFAATVTGPDGSTSEFSRCIALFTTTTTQAAARGSSRLEVAANDGFLHRVITVNRGRPNAERSYVRALGSLILAEPLRYRHEAGEPVEIEPDPLFLDVSAGLITLLPRAPDLAGFSGVLLPAEGTQLTCGAPVTLSLGGTLFQQTIPGARFRKLGSHCLYARTGSGGGVGLLDLDLTRGTWTLTIDGVQLDTVANPVTLALSLGDIRANASVTMTRVGPVLLFTG
jgi:PKD domain